MKANRLSQVASSNNIFIYQFAFSVEKFTHKNWLLAVDQHLLISPSNYNSYIIKVDDSPVIYAIVLSKEMKSPRVFFCDETTNRTLVQIKQQNESIG